MNTKLNIAAIGFVLSMNAFSQVNFNQLMQESATKPAKVQKTELQKAEVKKDETKNEKLGKVKVKDIKVQEWEQKISKLNKEALSNTQKLITRGGSGIGGGNTYGIIIDWCDQASEILDESRLNAQDQLGLYNDKLSALKIYFEGLKNALEMSESNSQNASTSITYRAILRGLNLSGQLGVIDLIYGNGEYQSKKIDDAIYFLDDYYQFVLNSAYRLDQSHYYRDCSDCGPNYRSVDQLEKEFIGYVNSQLKFWIDKFIPEHSNREGAFSTISLRNALQGLSYLADASATDLETSYYNNVYRCQASQLKRLSRRITNTISSDLEASIQTAKLTIYREQTINIINKIETANCNF